MIDDACRIRVIRAILGLNSRSFAARVGISPTTMTAWEQGRSTPQSAKRQELAKICHQERIAFLPSGFPVPAVDCLAFKENKNA
jgi:DNA-binding XRE family transcriptional regulator